MTKIPFKKYIFLVRPFFFFYYFEENLVVWQKEEINLMHHVCFVQTSKFLWAETHTDWGIPPQIHWISSVLHNISDCGGNSGNAGTTSSVQSDGGASTAHMLPPSGWKLTSCIKWLNSRNLKLFLTSIQSNKCWYVSLFLNLLIKSDFFTSLIHKKGNPRSIQGQSRDYLPKESIVFLINFSFWSIKLFWIQIKP